MPASRVSPRECLSGRRASTRIDAQDVAQGFGESEAKALIARGSDAWGAAAAPAIERFSSLAWAVMIARAGR